MVTPICLRKASAAPQSRGVISTLLINKQNFALYSKLDFIHMGRSGGIGKASISRLSNTFRILTQSASSDDIQEIVTGQQCWRTNASVSRKVGSSFVYHAT